MNSATREFLGTTRVALIDESWDKRSQMYAVWHSSIHITELCPSPVFGPNRKNMFGNLEDIIPWRVSQSLSRQSFMRQPEAPVMFKSLALMVSNPVANIRTSKGMVFSSVMKSPFTSFCFLPLVLLDCFINFTLLGNISLIGAVTSFTFLRRNVSKYPENMRTRLQPGGYFGVSFSTSSGSAFSPPSDDLICSLSSSLEASLWCPG
mmetsp:Transcript_27489/g.38373  ORF Transcript_27489/g.38373 Transcript_27489/m.38373 type:complete len:206 (+) Transcript_27489:727-1344(+)